MAIPYKLFSNYMIVLPIRRLRYFSQSIAVSKDLYRLEQNIINPSFTSNKIPESLLALSIHNNIITYLHMTCDYYVKDWSTLKLYEDSRTRSTVRNTYQELIWEAVRLLPSASLYLMEDTSSPLGGHTVSLPVALWQCRIETTLVTLLNAQPSSPSSHLVDNPGELTYVEGDLQETESVVRPAITPTGSFRHNVYKLKPSVVGRYFDIFIAGRRTSCAALAENLAERRGIFNDKFSRVRVSLPAAENFKEETKRATKDQMGYCLLEAIYFYNQLEELRTKKLNVSK